MERAQDKDTRYFIDIALDTQKLINHGYDQKQKLDEGRQADTRFHRLFLSKGQYNAFVELSGLNN